MGYLNYQIEHHLFPTMPNFRQREMAWRVKELAKNNGLPYMCTSYAEAMTLAVKNLAHVSEEIKGQAKLQDDWSWVRLRNQSILLMPMPIIKLK